MSNATATVSDVVPTTTSFATTASPISTAGLSCVPEQGFPNNPPGVQGQTWCGATFLNYTATEAMRSCCGQNDNTDIVYTFNTCQWCPLNTSHYVGYSNNQDLTLAFERCVDAQVRAKYPQFIDRMYTCQLGAASTAGSSLLSLGIMLLLATAIVQG